jgi:hypothetical protein
MGWVYVVNLECAVVVGAAAVDKVTTVEPFMKCLYCVSLKAGGLQKGQ